MSTRQVSSTLEQSDEVAACPGAATERDPVAVVDAFTESYTANRIEEAMSYLADDVTYQLHIEDAPAPFGGVTEGKAAVRAQLLEFRKVFDYVLYNPRNMDADGDTVRQRLEFIYRHRRSGARLSGHGRLVWRVKDGLVTRCDEYQDAAMIAAFFRLFGAG